MASPAEFVNPVTAVQALEEAMDDDAIMVVDGGDFVATAAYVVKPRAPLSWLDPGVFGTLGVGGGFALGAAFFTKSRARGLAHLGRWFVGVFSGRI